MSAVEGLWLEGLYLHASEVEVRDNDIIGAAVHLASRIMEKTGANEVLVSRIVCDLVAGS